MLLILSSRVILDKHVRIPLVGIPLWFASLAATAKYKGFTLVFRDPSSHSSLILTSLGSQLKPITVKALNQDGQEPFGMEIFYRLYE